MERVVLVVFQAASLEFWKGQTILEVLAHRQWCEAVRKRAPDLDGDVQNSPRQERYLLELFISFH